MALCRRRKPCAELLNRAGDWARHQKETTLAVLMFQPGRNPSRAGRNNIQPPCVNGSQTRGGCHEYPNGKRRSSPWHLPRDVRRSPDRGVWRSNAGQSAIERADLDLRRNVVMRLATVAAATASLTLALWIAPAEAKGCLKGALVGGVAGHYAGHHGAIGAVGGCVVGHHLANEPEGAQSAQPPTPPPPKN